MAVRNGFILISINCGDRKPHVNVGTIGHVDHGKTTLTAAITKVISLFWCIILIIISGFYLFLSNGLLCDRLILGFGRRG